MGEQFKQYVISLYQNIPNCLYVGLALVFFIGAVSFFILFDKKKGLRYSSFLLLLEYVFLFICSTVVLRSTNENLGYDFHPFWSYSEIFQGKYNLLAENIMNVIVFVPIGLLLGLSFDRMKWRGVLLISVVGSSIIEILQLSFKRGFAEIDDIMHNSLGCLIGFGIFSMTRLLNQALFKRGEVIK